MLAQPIRLALIALGLMAFGAKAATPTRTAAFEYDPTTGLLTKEIIEPDTPTLCLVTTYVYDSFGNVTSTNVRNCNGSSSEAAAPAGGSNAIITARPSSTGYGVSATPTSTSVCTIAHTYPAGQF